MKKAITIVMILLASVTFGQVQKKVLYDTTSTAGVRFKVSYPYEVKMYLQDSLKYNAVTGQFESQAPLFSLSASTLSVKVQRMRVQGGDTMYAYQDVIVPFYQVATQMQWLLDGWNMRHALMLQCTNWVQYKLNQEGGSTGTGTYNTQIVFTPAAHTHAEEDITNLITDLGNKAASVHTHSESDITNLVTDLANKANANHTHQGLPVYAMVSGSNATTTGQSLVDVTGLTIPLVAGATYEIEAILETGTTAVTTGTQYGVNFSASGATVSAMAQGSYTTTASAIYRISALNSATGTFMTSSAQTGGVEIKGIVTTGANAGNLTIQHLKVTSGTSTVYTGSYIKATRIQ